MHLLARLRAVGAAVVAVPVWMLRAVVRLFGFMTLKYVRGIAGGVFALTAAAGIALSISDHSHRLISYVAWYGAAGVAFVVAAVTTVIIDRRETKSERKARRQRGRRRLWPWGHPEVGKIHEQDLHNWLAAIDQSVGRGEACGYGAFPDGARQYQRAIAAHFSDLRPKLVEWDQALARQSDCARCRP